MIRPSISGKRARKHISSLLVFLLIVVLSSLTSPSSSPEPSVISPSPQIPTSPRISAAATGSAEIIRVIDGDTAELATGEKVRYIGIDTPEVTGRTGPDCFAAEASLKNKELVEGKTVTLVKDVSEIDRYGRLLRYVFVGDIFVNEYLVREGFAFARSYPPDVLYQDRLMEAEEHARTGQKGLWGSQCNL